MQKSDDLETQCIAAAVKTVKMSSSRLQMLSSLSRVLLLTALTVGSGSQFMLRLVK